MFGFFKGKRKVAKIAKDPLAAYDSVIDSLERQGAEVRKNAATLLALRGELQRDRERYAQRLTDLQARLLEAERAQDVKATKTLSRDLDEAKRLRESTMKALTEAESDARLLMEAAEDLSKQVSELKTERVSAKARFAAGQEVSEALKQQVADFDRVVKIDAARDEIERAHALAELYREDVKAKR